MAKTLSCLSFEVTGEVGGDENEAEVSEDLGWEVDFSLKRMILKGRRTLLLIWASGRPKFAGEFETL